MEGGLNATASYTWYDICIVAYDIVRPGGYRYTLYAYLGYYLGEVGTVRGKVGRHHASALVSDTGLILRWISA